MKRLLVCSVVALAVLVVGYSAMGEAGDKGKGKGPKAMARAHPRMQDANAPAVHDVNAMKNRAQQRAEQMTGVFQARIGRLEAIKQIAVKEGATKTVEALDKFIADEKKQQELRTNMMHEMRAKQKAGIGSMQNKGKEKGWQRKPVADPNA